MPSLQSIRVQRGFTLLELAIVLVIIGLVVGAILFGRDLISNVRIKKIHSQSQMFVTAVRTFQTKYDCIPGDCPFATDIFGEDDDCIGIPDGSAYLPATKTPGATGTCNGNGDGQFDGTGFGSFYEGTEAWKQMGHANLVEGAYSGAWTGAVPYFRPGMDCPTVHAAPTFCWIWTSSWNSGLGWAQQLLQMNIPTHSQTVLGIYPSKWNGAPTPGLLFTPAEALAFDSKYDDGLPRAGHILVSNHRAAGYAVAACTNGAAGTSYAANIGSLKDAVVCLPYIVMRNFQ